MKGIMTTIMATSLALSLGAGAAAAAPPAQEPAAGSSAAGAGQMARVKAVIQNARLDGMKAVLKLTPDQEKYWASFQAAVSGSYALRNQTTASTRQAIATDDPAQLLDKLADNASKGAAQMKKVAEAAKPLYDSLDPAQRQAFGPLLLTLSTNPTTAATRARRLRHLLMQRWSRSESNTAH